MAMEEPTDLKAQLMATQKGWAEKQAARKEAKDRRRLQKRRSIGLSKHRQWKVDGNKFQTSESRAPSSSDSSSTGQDSMPEAAETVTIDLLFPQHGTTFEVDLTKHRGSDGRHIPLKDEEGLMSRTKQLFKDMASTFGQSAKDPQAAEKNDKGARAAPIKSVKRRKPKDAQAAKQNDNDAGAAKRRGDRAEVAEDVVVSDKASAHSAEGLRRRASHDERINDLPRLDLLDGESVPGQGDVKQQGGAATSSDGKAVHDRLPDGCGQQTVTLESDVAPGLAAASGREPQPMQAAWTSTVDSAPWRLNDVEPASEEFVRVTRFLSHQRSPLITTLHRASNGRGFNLGSALVTKIRKFVPSESSEHHELFQRAMTAQRERGCAKHCLLHGTHCPAEVLANDWRCFWNLRKPMYYNRGGASGKKEEQPIKFKDASLPLPVFTLTVEFRTCIRDSCQVIAQWDSNDLEFPGSLAVQLANSGNLEYVERSSGTEACVSADPPSNLADDAWHLASISRTRTGNVFLYVDSELVGRGSMGHTVPRNLCSTAISADSSGAHVFRGHVGPLLLYQKMLSSDDVRQLSSQPPWEDRWPTPDSISKLRVDAPRSASSTKGGNSSPFGRGIYLSDTLDLCHGVARLLYGVAEKGTAAIIVCEALLGTCKYIGGHEPPRDQHRAPHGFHSLAGEVSDATGLGRSRWYVLYEQDHVRPMYEVVYDFAAYEEPLHTAQFESILSKLQFKDLRQLLRDNTFCNLIAVGKQMFGSKHLDFELLLARGVATFMHHSEARRRIAALGALSRLPRYAISHVGQLVNCLQDSDADVRRAAISALACLDEEHATQIDAWTETLRSSHDREVTHDSMLALGRLALRSALYACAVVLSARDDDEEVRVHSASVLTSIDNRLVAYVRTLGQTLQHVHPDVQTNIASFLGIIGQQTALQAAVLTRFFQSVDSKNDDDTVSAFGRLEEHFLPNVMLLSQRLRAGTPEVQDATAQMLPMVGQHVVLHIGALVMDIEDEDADVRYDAACSLGKLGMHAAPYCQVLLQRMNDAAPRVQKAVLSALRQIDRMLAPQMEGLATQALQSEDSQNREDAVRLLGKFGDFPATQVGFLVMSLLDDVPHIREAASNVLRTLGYEDREALIGVALDNLQDSKNAIRISNRSETWKGMVRRMHVLPVLPRATSSKSMCELDTRFVEAMERIASQIAEFIDGPKALAHTTITKIAIPSRPRGRPRSSRAAAGSGPSPATEEAGRSTAAAPRDEATSHEVHGSALGVRDREEGLELGRRSFIISGRSLQPRVQPKKRQHSSTTSLADRPSNNSDITIEDHISSSTWSRTSTSNISRKSVDESLPISGTEETADEQPPAGGVATRFLPSQQTVVDLRDLIL